MWKSKEPDPDLALAPNQHQNRVGGKGVSVKIKATPVVGRCTRQKDYLSPKLANTNTPGLASGYSIAARHNTVGSWEVTSYY